MLNRKQLEVLDCIRNENPKILVCSGGVRAGKTFILTYAFMEQVARYKNQGLDFILAGASSAALRRNVLDDMEKIIDRELKLDKDGRFLLFGNKINCFDGKNADTWKKIRGFTAAGAFMNEGTALHDMFVKEVVNRCSYKGARIFIDTNPDNPQHYIKTDYIDKDGQKLSSGRTNIRAFHFTLFDNDTLDPEYIDSTVKATPSGMYTDRNIYGKWVSPEGVVYPDFSDTQYVSPQDIDKMEFISYFAGVDWGYEHYGAIALCGVRTDGAIVVIRIYSAQHQEIEYWDDVAKKLMDEYGDIPFYCDSEDPEKITHFRRNGIDAIKAKKAVIAGIEQVARGWKLKRLFVVDNNKRFKDEIYQYVWKATTGEPIRLNDDVLSAIRYAIYSYFIFGDTNWDKLGR